MEKCPTKLSEANHRIWSFVKATTKIMKITTGEEAMNLLRNSERIHSDLAKILHFEKVSEKLCNSDLVFREWMDECPDRPEYEFRGFVNNNQLNALSMYCCFAYSQELVERKDHVERLILNCFQVIKDKIPHPSYVIDFYVTKADKVIVIELNPFHIGAGACLFSWKEHRNKFLHGPFEFRITTSLSENTEEIIPKQWQRILMAKYGPTQGSVSPTLSKEGWLSPTMIAGSVVVVGFCIGILIWMRK